MRNSFWFRKLVGLSLLAGLIAGCAAPTQRISDADKKAFKTVNISNDVKKPPLIYYLGASGSAGLMFGLVGALATQDARERQLKAFQEQVEKNGVFIERIVFEELEKAVRESGKLAVSDKPEPGAATLSVSIVQYGFSVPNALSSKLVPILHLKCDMADAGGRIVWSASDRVLTLGNPAEAVEAAQIRENPKVMENAWRTAAKAIAANILKEF
jgi:hypothetical protein